MKDIFIPCPKCKKIMDKMLYSNRPVYKCNDCNLKYRYEEDRLIDVSLSRNYNNSKKENKQKAWIKL